MAQQFQAKMNSRSKKGFFTDTVVDAFSFIAIVLIIMLFGGMLTLIKDKGAYLIEGAAIELDQNAALNQMLRSGAVVDGYKTDLAGYIIYAKDDPVKAGKLKEIIDTQLKIVVVKSSMECMRLSIESTSTTPPHPAPGQLPPITDPSYSQQVITSSYSEKKIDDCAIGGKTTIHYLPSISGPVKITLTARAEDKQTFPGISLAG